MATGDFDDDPMRQALAHASTHDVDAVRAERTRQRCHRALAREATRAARHRRSRADLRRLVEPALVAGVSLAWLAEVVRHALQLFGV